MYRTLEVLVVANCTILYFIFRFFTNYDHIVIGARQEREIVAVKGGRNLWPSSHLSLGTYLMVPVWVDPWLTLGIVLLWRLLAMCRYHACMWVDPRHSAQMAPISYVYVPYLYVG
jgi:hypothetical protein